MANESRFAAGFDSAGFVDAVKQTMKMGMPENEEDRLTFHWTAPVPTGITVAPSGVPYDLNQRLDATPVETDVTVPLRSLSVDYAIEPNPATVRAATLLGRFDAPLATVTMLDDDWEQIADADYATIGSTTYEILFEGPQIAMFNVGVHTLYLQAVDEA